MRFFKIASLFGVMPPLFSLFFCFSALAGDEGGVIKIAGDKLLGDPYFYNQQCKNNTENSIFCLKDYFYGRSDWYPVGIVTIGHKPETVIKLVNGMESSAGVVLDTYEFNKLIYDKNAVDIAVVSGDGREFGVFNISYLMSRVGMCKSLNSLADMEIFHYEDSGCDITGSDYSFFGVHKVDDKKNTGDGLLKGNVNGTKVKNDGNASGVSEIEGAVGKNGFYLLSNSGGKISGYRMPKGFSDNNKFYLMIK